jgi:3-dehydroquinate synthase
MERVTVALGSRSYPIWVGSGLLERAANWVAPLLKRRRLFVVTDQTVALAQLPRLAAGLSSGGVECIPLVLEPGERTKSFAQFESLLNQLLHLGVERSDVLAALGGGVIGDLTGFAASVLRRGVDFVQIPTTLLAQVDSSVGGKTGINTQQGKNLVGTFHQPRLVLADRDSLQTLPDRQRKAGYAEVVKYGLIDDRSFFEWLEANGASVLSLEPSAYMHGVVSSCRAKARIVAEDERESGRRALLNLGHTFGHALEAANGFGDALLHGEAVAIGMVLAFDFSVRLGICPAEDSSRVRAHLSQVGLPVDLRGAPGVRNDARQLVQAMGQDKKVIAGKLHFILTRGIGKAFTAADVALDELEAFLEAQLKG